MTRFLHMGDTMLSNSLHTEEGIWEKEEWKKWKGDNK